MFVQCEIDGRKFRAETDIDSGVSPCQQNYTREKLFDLLRNIADLSFKSGFAQEGTSFVSGFAHDETQDQKPTKSDDDDYGPRFFVVDLGDGVKDATRSKTRISDGVPLTRRLLYRGRMEQAAFEYAHSFMCGGFPTKPDQTRPTKDEWLDKEPYEFEVDKFVSEKLFG